MFTYVCLLQSNPLQPSTHVHCWWMQLPLPEHFLLQNPSDIICPQKSFGLGQLNVPVYPFLFENSFKIRMIPETVTSFSDVQFIVFEPMPTSMK